MSFDWCHLLVPREYIMKSYVEGPWFISYFITVSGIKQITFREQIQSQIYGPNQYIVHGEKSHLQLTSICDCTGL